MASFNKTEFWIELDATDEAFVRRKLAMGGYSPTRKKLVAEWLKDRDAQKLADRDATGLRAAIQTARWTQIGVVGTGCGTILLLIAHGTCQ